MLKKNFVLCFILVVFMSIFLLSGCGKHTQNEMVLVKAGTTSKIDLDETRENYGRVTVEEDFYIGKYPVTQEEFEEVMGFNYSYFNDNNNTNLKGNSDNRPVECVTWYDAVKYCNELSEAEGLDKYYNISDIEYWDDIDNFDGNLDGSIANAIVTENEGANGYRLPTEDEHEYAARGGKDDNNTYYAGSDNLDEVAWYSDNSDKANSDRDDNRGTMPVGEKKANELGLYDMSGNVWEWTNSPKRSRHTMAGGSWGSNAFDCGLSHAQHSYWSPAISIGFRIARRP